MAKKENLKNGFGSLLQKGNTITKDKTSVNNSTSEQTISAQEQERRRRAGRHKAGDGSKRSMESYAYTSLALEIDAYEKIRQIASLNGLPYRDIINAALRKYVELYEAKHGPVQTPRESNISADSLI